jgi:hypothetical protein
VGCASIRASTEVAAEPASAELEVLEDFDVERFDKLEFAGALDFLRRLIPCDSELAELHRQAERAYFTQLPAVFALGIVLAFCERYLQLTEDEPEGKYRELVEAIAQKLQPLSDDMDVSEGLLVRTAAEMLAPLPRTARARPSWPPEVVHRLFWAYKPIALRRRRGRESRQSRGQRRLRVRSGSRGDPPSPGDSEPPLAPSPAAAGRLGVEAAS